jgi:CubicO group peptidase (beta-lactamase class C family)
MAALKCFVLAAVLIAAASAKAQVAPELVSKRLDELFGHLDKAPSPGLAVVVVRDGKPLLAKGYGLADLEHKIPVTPSTLFHLGSCGKQFTGLAIAMLVGQGVIRLDDDIRKYIPELHDFGSKITIDHLLRHTSGLRDWTAPVSLTGWRFDDAIGHRDIMSFAFRQRTLNFAPGAKELYSNTGYGLLAELVQRVTRKPLRTWSEEHIFQPLGMASTRARDDHGEVLTNVARGYSRAAGGAYRRMTDNMVSLGSSSVWSTADDLAKWMINFETGVVGGRQAIELMQTPGVLNDGAKVHYGFGLAYGSEGNHPVLNHEGGWAGVTAFIAYFPKDKVGVAALSNGPIPNMSGSVYDLALSLAKGEAPVGRPSSAAPPAEAPRPLDDYVGLYRFGPGEFLRVQRYGNVLASQVSREGPIGLSAGKQPDAWNGRNGPMTFHRGDDGKVTSLEMGGKKAVLMSGKESQPPADLKAYEGIYESQELETFYRVVVKNGVLELRHGRRGALPLTWLWPDEFTSADPYLGSVKFLRRNGRITGLLINGSTRARDIRFERR